MAAYLNSNVNVGILDENLIKYSFNGKDRNSVYKRMINQFKKKDIGAAMLEKAELKAYKREKFEQFQLM